MNKLLDSGDFRGKDLGKKYYIQFGAFGVGEPMGYLNGEIQEEFEAGEAI